MKIEGMDAATKTTTVPVQNPEQAQSAPTVSAKPRVIESKDKVGLGSTGKTIIKVRIATENPTEKLYSQQEDGASEKLVREAIERANRMLYGSDRKFEISVHEKTKDIMVRVVDTRTNETIREIPPQKIVDLVANLCEIAGILFDEKG